MRVAIVHDWLIGGGAEKVVEALNELYPEAPIYTSYATEEWRQKLNGQVRTGYLQSFGPLRKYLPFLRAWWFSHLNLSDYDLVISSSGAEAKGIKVGPKTVHINYCHAPTHYYWSRYNEYMKHPGFGVFDPFARLGLKLLVGPMRRWDHTAAQRPHFVIANSSHTQSEIKKYYGRDAVVIHPPVDIERFGDTSNAKRAGYVITGRQTPYKRVDLAVKACTTLNLPLMVIGNGPDNKRLKELAGSSVEFLDWITNEEVVTRLQSAQAFLFPGVDDFGISAVEALAAGTPVIAYKGGGALDYVTPGKNGEFFYPQTNEALVETLKSFIPDKYSQSDIKATAAQFSKKNFKEKLLAYIHSVLQ